MRTLKSLFCLFIILSALSFSLAGCGGKSDGDSSSATNGASSSPSAIASAYSDGIDENGFWDGVTARDYVELYDYDAFVVPSSAQTVSDADVQSSIDALLDGYSTSEQIKDRAVADGDTVNIDYVGSVGGVEFDGGSTGGMGTDVTIGVTSYIDDFLEQLIGHKAGDTFDVNVTFPADYGQENLNGKDAVFVTTVNYIVETKRPELTDAFVKENLTADYGWETVAETKDAVRADLHKAAIQAYIQRYLNNDVNVKSVPDSLVEYQKNVMVQYYQNYADSYGVSLDEFLNTYVGFASLDELISSNAESNVAAAKTSLIFQAIAEDAGIKATNSDVAEYFKKETGSEDYSQYEQNFGLPYIKQATLSWKVMDYLSEHCVLE